MQLRLGEPEWSKQNYTEHLKILQDELGSAKRKTGGDTFIQFGPASIGKSSSSDVILAGKNKDQVPTYFSIRLSEISVTNQKYVRRIATLEGLNFNGMSRIKESFAGIGRWGSKVPNSLEIEDENPARKGVDEENAKKVQIKKLLEVEGGGFAYTSFSIPQDAGLSLSPFPGLLEDTVVVSWTDVPIVLTFSTDPGSEAALTYNRKLATLLLRKLRKSVDEDFTFAFGVVGEDDTESLLDRVKTLRERSTRFALRRYLIMTPEKCESLTRGLVSMLSEEKM